MELLIHGYKIPFKQIPGPYEDVNNKSAIKHSKFLWDKILEWETAGFCIRTKEKPYCVNPITVAEKIDPRTNKLKLRPCLDFSRHVNHYIKDQSVRLTNLQEAEKLLEKDDWQTSFDMLNMYFHVRVNEEFQKFFGCQVTSPEGEKIYFIFLVMIYGIKDAVFTVTKLTKPIVKKSNLLGIRFSIFIDDGKILGTSKSESEENLQTILGILKNAGWNINETKTVTVASQSLYHQGLITCTNPLLYILPDFKINIMMYVDRYTCIKEDPG